MHKFCTTCKTNQPLELFSKNKAKRDGLSTMCKPCFNIYRKKHYEANKPRYLQWVGATKKLHRYQYRLAKSNGCCKDCGISYPGEPWMMDYDHVGEKKGNVSSLLGNGMKSLEAEIKKCELVCPVCHRRRTAKRAGWTFKEVSANA